MKLTQFELKKMKVGDLFANKRVEGCICSSVYTTWGVSVYTTGGLFELIKYESRGSIC